MKELTVILKKQKNNYNLAELEAFATIRHMDKGVGVTFYVSNWKNFSGLYILYSAIFKPLIGSKIERKMVDFLK